MINHIIYDLVKINEFPIIIIIIIHNNLTKLIKSHILYDIGFISNQICR